MPYLLNGGNVPKITGDGPPLVDHVATPKVEEINLRPGYFLGRPLRTPRRTTLEGIESYEAERWLVLKSEPDERPEMAWSTKIKAGMVVTMAGPVHAVPMRVDLAGFDLGRSTEAPDEKGRVIGDALLLVHAQIVAFDERELNPGEFQNVKVAVRQAEQTYQEDARIDAGLHG